MSAVARLLAALTCALVAVAAPALGAGSFSVTTAPYPRGVAPPGASPVYVERETPGAQALRITHRGRDRTYRLYAPSSAAGPLPVVVLLHGAQRTGRSMIDMWAATADRHGLALVAVDAAGPSWSPADDGPDLLVAALNDAASRAPLDPARVYLFGHSSGAILAILYANRVRGPWKAAAAHAGFPPPSAVAPAAAPVPMRLFLGAQDHLFRPDAAREAGAALAAAGHVVELVQIAGHTHWYYAIGPAVSERAWAFFSGAD